MWIKKNFCYSFFFISFAININPNLRWYLSRNFMECIFLRSIHFSRWIKDRSLARRTYAKWLHSIVTCHIMSNDVRSMVEILWLRVGSRTHCRGHVTTTFTGRIELQVPEIMARTLSNTSHLLFLRQAISLLPIVRQSRLLSMYNWRRLLRNSIRAISSEISVALQHDRLNFWFWKIYYLHRFYLNSYFKTMHAKKKNIIVFFFF